PRLGIAPLSDHRHLAQQRPARAFDDGRGLAPQLLPDPPLPGSRPRLGRADSSGKDKGCYDPGMRAGAAVSREEDVSLAARDAATRALDAGGLDEAGCLVVAATPEQDRKSTR